MICEAVTLEDFFTLTEMKDGLTALSRVEDLVTVMQKEKDCAVKNVGEASRQWVAVASTIAATENKDCLDLFIKLDGLWFIDRWLKDAQKFCTDSNESFLEESITTLLQALEVLHIDHERSVSSGIWITVENLLGHKSSTVQGKARLLFDGWKQEKVDAAGSGVAQNVLVSHDDGSSKLVSEDSRPTVSGTPSEGTVEGETQAIESSAELKVPLVNSDIQLERGDDVQINAENNQLSSQNNFYTTDIKERAEDELVSSVVSNPAQGNPSTKEDSDVCSPGGTSVQNDFLDSRMGTGEEQPDSPKVNGAKTEKQDDKVDSSSANPSEPKTVESDADPPSSQDLTKQPLLQNNCEANEVDTGQKISTNECAIAPASDSKSAVGESRDINNCNPAEDGECCSNSLQESSVNGSLLGNQEDLEKASTTDNLGAVVEDEEDASDEDRDFRNAYEFSKPVMDTKRSDAIAKRRSDVELDYGVDPLEVARRVAKAVEREVGDFKGICSSSSEKISEDGSKQPGSPDSVNERQDLPSEGLAKDATEQSNSAEACPKEEVRGRNVANQGTAAENCKHDMDSSQVTQAAQETENNMEKGPCGFDLNEEVFFDEMEHPVNPVSTTISIVSASRPATTPGLPVAPLKFEGTLGWKGSAATSAFRPASPRRNSDSDKNLSVAGTSDSSSKQRQDWLDIDLNVAEAGDDIVKKIPASSGLPSGESSVEVSPKRTERFKLDLNRIEDDGDVILLSSRVEGQHSRNGHHSPSPASSSSSMQPSMRNFDLNDRPSFNDPLDQGLGKLSQTVNAFVVPKSDASVISIMGTRVEINKKDFVPQVLSVSNGKAIEPAVDATMTGTGNFLGLAPSGTYVHSPIFGYNGLSTPPTMSLSPAMYGPGGAIPCIVDSRATIMPQIMPSASSVPPYSQPPFIMSLTGAQPSLNGAGPSRPNFDLNSGFMVEAGNRDLGLRQFFIPGQGRPVEEHVRTNSQPPSSSGVGGKRKEPDGGWEAYQFSYKQQQQHPWR